MCRYDPIASDIDFLKSGSKTPFSVIIAVTISGGVISNAGLNIFIFFGAMTVKTSELLEWINLRIF